MHTHLCHARVSARVDLGLDKGGVAQGGVVVEHLCGVASGGFKTARNKVPPFFPSETNQSSERWPTAAAALVAYMLMYIQ